jgi:hypothetical protein
MLSDEFGACKHNQTLIHHQEKVDKWQEQGEEY